jgi:hypothetical protein
VTEDGRYLFVRVKKGCDPNNQMYFHDLAAAGEDGIRGRQPLTPLFDRSDASYSVRLPFVSLSTPAYHAMTLAVFVL